MVLQNLKMMSPPQGITHSYLSARISISFAVEFGNSLPPDTHALFLGLFRIRLLEKQPRLEALWYVLDFGV